jgi:hypothetical protein
MTPEPLLPLLRDVEGQLSELHPSSACEARLQLRLRREASARPDNRGRGLLLLAALGTSILATMLLLDPLDPQRPSPPLLAPPQSSSLGAASASASEKPLLPTPDVPPPVDRPRADLRTSLPFPSDTSETGPRPVKTADTRAPELSMTSEEVSPVPRSRLVLQDTEEDASSRIRSDRTSGGNNRAASPLLPLGGLGQSGATSQLPPAVPSPGTSPVTRKNPQNAPASNGVPPSVSTVPTTVQKQSTPPPESPTQEGGERKPVPSNGCFSDFSQRVLDVPPDEQSCDGPGFVRWSSEQNLWVGVVSCGNGAVRLYLSESEQGPFLPALDTAGHGQDHCELLVPGFTLGNEDDIASGSCSSCSTGANVALEGVPGYARSQLGEPFVYVPETSAWSYQTSRLSCGCSLGEPSATP